MCGGESSFGFQSAALDLVAENCARVFALIAPRQTYCSLDVDKLWLARPQDTEHMFSFIALDKDSKVEEEGGYNSFSITSPSSSQKTVFRAASKEEMVR